MRTEMLKLVFVLKGLTAHDLNRNNNLNDVFRPRANKIPLDNTFDLSVNICF